MIISKATWVALTLFCQVSYETRDSQRCYVTMGEISKSKKECEGKKRLSEKCVVFDSGEFLLFYDKPHRRNLR